MPYISLQYLLRSTTDPERQLFLEQFYNIFDRGGVHKKIVNVEPLYYQGFIAATEFLVYSVNKMYLAYKVAAYKDTGSLQTNPPYFLLNDETDNDSLLEGCYSAFYNTTLPQTEYGILPAIFNNVYFSRAIVQLYDMINFNGYRITLN
jgi:hypothetical protein